MVDVAEIFQLQHRSNLPKYESGGRAQLRGMPVDLSSEEVLSLWIGGGLLISINKTCASVMTMHLTLLGIKYRLLRFLASMLMAAFLTLVGLSS